MRAMVLAAGLGIALVLADPLRGHLVLFPLGEGGLEGGDASGPVVAGGKPAEGAERPTGQFGGGAMGTPPLEPQATRRLGPPRFTGVRAVQEDGQEREEAQGPYKDRYGHGARRHLA